MSERASFGPVNFIPPGDWCRTPIQTRRGRHDVKAMSEHPQRPYPAPPFEKASVTRSRASRLSALLLLGLFLSSVLSGCSTEKSIEAARQKGANDGYNDGYREGEAEGRAAVYEDSKGESYVETLDQMYKEDQYTRVRSYTFTVLGVSFLLGFGLQYTALYLLRRNALLFDIDRIVMRGRVTSVDLNDISGPGVRSLATRPVLELKPAARPHEEDND